MNKSGQQFNVTFAFNLFLFSLLAFAGCATKHSKSPNVLKLKDRPETVLVTYHVKVGMEKDFEELLARAWKTYRSEHLVKSEPHVLVRDDEENYTVGYVEVFTWVSHAAPQNASESVRKIWAEEQAMCEARNGRVGIGGGEVEPLIPRK